jgi:hypothetical protein
VLNFLLANLLLNGATLRTEYLENGLVFREQSRDEKSVLIRKEIDLEGGGLLGVLF